MSNILKKKFIPKVGVISDSHKISDYIPRNCRSKSLYGVTKGCENLAIRPLLVCLVIFLVFPHLNIFNEQNRTFEMASSIRMDSGTT